jgi:hypothetical protein
MRTLRYSLRRVSPLDSVNGGTHKATMRKHNAKFTGCAHLESPPLEVLCLAEAHRFTPGVTGLTQMNSAPATSAARF